MPSTANTFNSQTAFFDTIVREAYLAENSLRDLMLGQPSGPIRRQIRRGSDLVTGIKAKVTFLTNRTFGVSPTPRFGVTPTGGVETGKDMEWEMPRYMVGAQWEEMDARQAAQNLSLMKNLVMEKINGMTKAFNFLDKLIVYAPSSGTIGVIGSISGNTVTLVNTGLQYASTIDANRLFDQGASVQVYSSAGVKIGGPRNVTGLRYRGNTIVLDDVTGLSTTSAGEFIVPTDTSGLTDTRGQWGVSLWDLIDDNNTFQGIDRSLAANLVFRAYVEDGSSGSGAVTFDKLTTFFANYSGRVALPMPTKAYTCWNIINTYYQGMLQTNVRYQGGAPNMRDGYNSIIVGETLLVQDDEIPSDRIIIPGFDGISVQQSGPPEMVDGSTNTRLPGRMIYERLLMQYQLLVGTRFDNQGMLTGLNYAT